MKIYEKIITNFLFTDKFKIMEYSFILLLIVSSQNSSVLVSDTFLFWILLVSLLIFYLQKTVNYYQTKKEDASQAKVGQELDEKREG